jgi:hypothetical protein
MSLLGSALTAIGGKLLGSAVSSGLDYLYGSLPKGAQSFLSGVGDFFDVGSKEIGMLLEKLAKLLRAMQQKDMPKPTMNSVGSSMAAGSMTGAGAGAQMLPLGGTDRVSRALQDARVAEKIMRMTGQAPIPTSNIRMGQTIGLGSATAPRTSLTKKFSK